MSRRTDIRTVHAESERHELVRYDRMGEWRRAKEYQS